VRDFAVIPRLKMNVRIFEFSMKSFNPKAVEPKRL
jgi:hypothetical protein